MLAIGCNLCFEEMLSLWRKPALLFRALLAVVVLVPLVVIVLLKLFNLPPEVMTGLALLAASPGAPLTTKRAQMAGCRFSYSASFQLTLAILAVCVTPITLEIFVTLFENISEKVTILEVTRQVIIVQLLPVSIGLLLQKFVPKFAENIAQPLNFIANSLFFRTGCFGWYFRDSSIFQSLGITNGCNYHHGNRLSNNRTQFRG